MKEVTLRLSEGEARDLGRLLSSHLCFGWVAVRDAQLVPSGEVSEALKEVSRRLALALAQGGKDNGTVCPECGGDGYLVHVGGPGWFSMEDEAWFPSERVETCPVCEGTGHV